MNLLKKAYAEGRRVMSPEHKQKLIEANNKRKGTKRIDDGLTHQQRWVLNNKEKEKTAGKRLCKKKKSRGEESNEDIV